MAAVVPFELVDEEEMLAIEAALQQAMSSSCCDIEEVVPMKKSLCVTDITSLEWCERQFEFAMKRGKPKKTAAMRAGNARHVELETEVISRVHINLETKEDAWAVRILNFTLGARQLLTLGMTREIPVIAFVEGVWLTGIIDELRLHDFCGLQLVDTKTRVRQSLPSEAQKRNGRLQLMCYKWLWDTMCEKGGIPAKQFTEYFGLQLCRQLSQALVSYADTALGSKVSCLDDLLRILSEACAFLPLAHTSLKLRYEWQVDKSLLGEEQFEFDLAWLRERFKGHLDFWHGRRRAQLVPEIDSWKCQFCAFADQCQPKWPAGPQETEIPCNNTT